MDYHKQLQAAQDHADKVKLKQELKELWHSNDVKKEKMSFSKVAFIFLISNCTVVEIYALVAMFYFGDLSSLSALIVAVIGECVSFLTFEIKSTKENTRDGIVFESAMKKLEYELEQNSDESVG